MSRLAKKPLIVPEGVKVSIEYGKILVEGKLGKLSQPFNTEFVEIKSDGKEDPSHKKGS